MKSTRGRQRRIAPCVARIPLRAPATFARQVLTIDHISNGRVEAGLGFDYPELRSQRAVFETIANDVVPALRESRKPSKRIRATQL